MIDHDSASAVSSSPSPSLSHPTLSDQDDIRKLNDWAERLRMPVSDVEVFCRNGFDYDRISSKDSPSRRDLLSCLRRREIAPSKWMMISGLFPDVEFSEPERRKRLRALYKATTLLIKRSLAREAADPFRSERSIYWDPIGEVCRDLELPSSKLSAFLKEFCGHSLSQLVDCVRAEKIQKLMRRQIRNFVREFRTQCASLVTENETSKSTPVPLTPNPSPSRGEGDVTPWVIWKALKASRRWPEFCSNSWALEFGFSSYRRMYRACVAVWKKTPHQLEMELISECLNVNETGDVVDDSFDEINLADIESDVRAIPCYSDES